MPPFVAAPHPPFPMLTKGRAGVFKNPRVVSVVAANDDLRADLFAFGDEIIASAWWNSVGAEFGVEQATEGTHIVGPPIVAGMSRAQMESYIQSAISVNPDMAPDGHTIYMLYLPDGIAAIVDTFNPPERNTNCHFYAGYHLPLGRGPDNWGVAQRCSLLGTREEQIDTLTETASHEIIESATDPMDGWQIPITSTTAPWRDSVWAWYYGGAVEDADLCETSGIRVGRFLYQRAWSNQAAHAGGDPCVPAIADAYYNTSAPKEWYPVAPGGSVDIPITGWSTGQVSDWAIEVTYTTGYQGFSASLESMTSTTSATGDFTRPTINNGRVATLSVTPPKNAVRGKTYVVISVNSVSLVPSTDMQHAWPVGVYVP
jgi:hypothetical protein